MRGIPTAFAISRLREITRACLPIARTSLLVALASAISSCPTGQFRSIAQEPPPLTYVSPRPGAAWVSPGTTIALRHGEVLSSHMLDDELLRVVGSRSGMVRGSLRLSDDSRTLLFQPAQSFQPGETVQVTMKTGLQLAGGTVTQALSFSFVVGSAGMQAHATDQTSTSHPPSDGLVPPDEPRDSQPAAAMPLSVRQHSTLPDDFPHMEATVPATEVGEGYVFLTVRDLHGSGEPYLLIIDDLAEPIYYQRFPFGDMVWDFKKQTNGTLTYTRYPLAGPRLQVALDSTYSIVDTYVPGNGYSDLDHHDFLALPDGHALLLIEDPQIIDMSQIVPGGDPEAEIVGNVIQELDGSRNVVWEWRTWDHFALTDSVRDLTEPRIIYAHVNSLEVDHDGHVIISSRALDEVTKINRDTGDIIWRFGGKNNQFSLVGDTQFFHFQHDARCLPNGHLTVFDNRTDWTPAYSRVVEYDMDEIAMTATLVWEYVGPYSHAMANAQRLANGNTVIGWGRANTTASEVTPDLDTVFETKFVRNADHETHQRDVVLDSYRAFRYPWVGRPAWPPTLCARPEGQGVRLSYSWNGATGIEAYRVLGGAEPSPTALVTTTTRSGFETTTVVTPPVEGPRYYRVMPIDSQGSETRFSNEISTANLRVGDLTIEDLTLSEVGWSLSLGWSGPSTAQSFELRYASNPITEQSWASATPLADHLPGDVQSYAATIPRNSRAVYFALRFREEVCGASALSNNAILPVQRVFCPIVLA
ncbi:MAG TPA: aryl-sulfate sulfotransferase [Anaerolineae bacterium]|nr:aryl-sulfate sulfotransferase [Anaerolineae bacterium]